MEKIGRYRLTRRLGSGSFATVWQGHDDDLDVPVAVKVLADNWADNEDVRNRFLSEARLMRRIRDERIVRVYDIGTLADNRPYFVMDFADGGSLENLRKQGIPPQLALRLCAEACRAIHVLHLNDVIHRDVTPGNVLLNRTRDNGVKVLIADLGVAKSMIDSTATMTAGTPAYMALEQANGVAKLDHRADIYSLAGVTYAMLTGRPPFPVKTLADVLKRDVTARPAPIAAQIGAPAGLDNLLAAALSAQPGLRPRTALELADALDNYADQVRADQRPARPAPQQGPTPTSLSDGRPSNTQAGQWSQAHAVQGGPVVAPTQPAGQATGMGTAPMTQPGQPGMPINPMQSFAAPQQSLQQFPAFAPTPMNPLQPASGLDPAPPNKKSTYVLIGIVVAVVFAISLLLTIVALQG